MTDQENNASENIVLIIGGGFGGIRCALDLAAKNIPNLKVRLITNTHYFDYHAALYRLVSGRSPLESCIPLSEIFKDSAVELCYDTAEKIDTDLNLVYGKDNIKYEYDYLVLAVGGEATYFNIPGVEENAFNLKTANDALKLRRKLEATLDVSNSSSLSKCHIVLVGAGPTGVELAGELAVFARSVAKRHGFPEENVRIDLVDRADRVLSKMSPSISKRVTARLKKLGVSIFLNKEVLREDAQTLFLKDIDIHSSVVIWTAGVKANKFLRTVSGLKLNHKDQVIVDDMLHAVGYKNVYVLGDAADTKHSGMAQTAIYDGGYIAESIIRQISDIPADMYAPPEPVYAIPVGPHWAAYTAYGRNYFGLWGWYKRRLLDLQVLSTMLPYAKALNALKYGVLVEKCDLCKLEQDNS